MKFRTIAIVVFLSLVAAFIMQVYWLRIFYIEQSEKLELDIMAAMRNADYKEIYGRLQQHSDTSQADNPDLSVFNDFLQVELLQNDLIFDSYTEMVNLQNDSVLSRIPEDISSIDKSEYKSYVYPFDIRQIYAYRLNVRHFDQFLFKQMSGIWGTSLLMIIVLCVSYLYLLKVIYRQKTLDEIKSDFVNNMTHELKTPISVAYAATDALQNYGMADDPAKRNEYLNITKEQLTHLSGLAEQILSMSMEKRKSLELSLEAIHLADIFNLLKDQFLLNATKEIRFTIDVKPEDLVIKADPVHFKNVIRNLIENAIKYSGNSVQIGLTARLEKNDISISIQDNGYGIPDNALPHVFDKFYRVPSGNIHNTKGYGLGLYYVKSIIEKQGGDIKVQSKEGKGTTFLIRLNIK